MDQALASLFVLCFYIGIQIYLGWKIGRNIHSEEGFILGNRQLGFFLSTATILTTWLGAEAMIGSAGSAFKSGLSGARMEPFGYSIALFLCGLILAHKLRAKRYTTLADLFSEAYSDRVERFSIFILVPSTLIWISAQNFAFATVLSTMLNINLKYALVLGAFIIISYSMMGGFLASAYTDLVQGIVLIIGLGLLLSSALFVIDGLSWSEIIAVATKERHSQPESWLATLDSWAVPILGSLVSQELIGRILATKTPKIARRATFSAAILYLLIGLIPVSLGLMGPLFALTPQSSDTYIAELAEHLMPQPVFLIFQLAIISAILSTADSSLLTVTGLTTHNFLKRFRAKLSNEELVLMNRFFVVVLGLISLVLTSLGDSIIELMQWASSLGTSGVLVITLVGLWTKAHSEFAALATLLVGLVSTVILHYVEWFEWPYLASILLSLLTYYLFYHLNRQST